MMRAAAVVSPFLASIGSPCLRSCVHGASIGGGGGGGLGVLPEGEIAAPAGLFVCECVRRPCLVYGERTAVSVVGVGRVIG
jgi:hypothetical protein